MDGLPGLEKVFREEFPKGKVQRCQVHVMRNVLAKVPQKLKQKVADDIRSIFYASSKEKALEFASQFTGRWQKEIPSAVKCLQNSLDSCLTFFDFPQEEWISLRTTNVIERLNKEFKRLLDNYGTHKHERVQRWLKRHRRFHLHFTPTGASWMNMVEIWFGILTNQAIRRASFDSVAQLIGAIKAFLTRWNEGAKPFVWTKTAEQILAKAVR
jgi:transposase